ncbi:MAG: ATP-binding protein [Candidatus Diapherotrites archaeon]|nr:ATP-binding protein [Candidatus Diapherotrites archaeon]
MFLKDALRIVARLQREDLGKSEKTVKRELLEKIDIDLPFAAVISGVRRCGKSTLLKQLTKETKTFYYFNFEDSKIAGFELSDFQRLDETLTEEFGENGVYFFDEIQNIPKWELFVREKLDKKRHFVITGSNASLLSKELGTRLTGRHLRFELFPFSFTEFLKFKEKKASVESFEEYLSKGGFPEYLKNERDGILQELLNDIMARDIIVRYGLRNLKTLRELAVYLLSNIGKEFSYTKLKETFQLGSVNTAISFISYFEDSYLLFTVPRFDYSLKKQQANPKKIYAIDNGFAKVNSITFSKDRGKMLENAVFLQLRRNFRDIYYYSGKKECDFLIKEKEKITQAIQVCYELTEENKEREINGLLEAMEKFKLKKGMILTLKQKDEIKQADKTIIVKPAWEWLKG